jgi:hypothetical protein
MSAVHPEPTPDRVASVTFDPLTGPQPTKTKDSTPRSSCEMFQRTLAEHPRRYMFFRFPPDARWNPDRNAVVFGIGVGEYEGVVRVSGRVFQILLLETPTPQRCLEAYHLQRTRLELVAERKVRRRQLTDDGNDRGHWSPSEGARGPTGAGSAIAGWLDEGGATNSSGCRTSVSRADQDRRSAQKDSATASDRRTDACTHGSKYAP